VTYHVLGNDAGTTHNGFALLAFPEREVVWRGECEFEDIARVMQSLASFDVRILGIEQPQEVYRHGAKKGEAARVKLARCINAARGSAGGVETAARMIWPEIRVVTGQAHECRKVLGKMQRCPKGTDARTWRDGIVAQRVPLLIPNWAACAGPNNTHTRDAAVAALWADVAARTPAALKLSRRRA
jgi:hypothetical protein